MKRVKLTIMFSVVLAVLLLANPTLLADKVEGIKQAAVLDSPTDFGTGLAWDGEYLWLADRKDGMLIKMNPASGKIVDRIKSPGYRPSGLTWDGSQLWISDLETRMIYRLDPKSKIVTHLIGSPVRSPYGLAWDGKLLWVLDASRDKSTISSVDPNDGTTIDSHKAPSSGGTGFAYDGKYLWVSDRYRDEIYMVSPEYGSVVNVFHAPGPFAYGLAWDGKYLWNVDYETDKIYALDIWGTGKHYTYGEKKEKVIFTTLIRNQGEGILKTFDLYYAVPEEIVSQTILGNIEWNPEPTGFIKDKWGQKVAHFHLEDIGPCDDRKIEMKVKLKTRAVQYIIDPEKVKGEIPKEILDKYLVDDLKYDIENPYIQKIVKKTIGDEKNYYWKARKLYDFLLENMYYELAGGWNTAPTVIKRGNGSCSEYTFSIISLCRAAGIPIRYVGSIVIRGDDASWDDVYHRWAQIYMPGYGWIDVDASRGDKEWPADQGRAFGGFSNAFLITTTGGGGSEFLSFNYNYDYKYTAMGRVNIHVSQMAEWEPVEEE